MPGTAAFYDRSDVWVADDEKLFSFDTEKHLIYWRDNEVDLMRICDKCADDVHRAATCVSRFRELYHIAGDSRKELVEDEREDEKKRARLLHAIATEVKRRRAREFAIRALKSHREGKIREEKEAEAQRRKEEKRRALEEAKRKHAEMIAKAASHDRKWLMQEVRADRKRLDATTDLTHLQSQPEYSLQNPFPALREHPHSWKLTPFHNGIPVTTSAVIQVIGGCCRKFLSMMMMMCAEVRHGHPRKRDVLRRTAGLERRRWGSLPQAPGKRGGAGPLGEGGTRGRNQRIEGLCRQAILFRK